MSWCVPGVAIFKVQVTIGPVMNHPEMTVRSRYIKTSVGTCVYQYVHVFSLHFALGPDIFEIELSFPEYEVHFITSQWS